MQIHIDDDVANTGRTMIGMALGQLVTADDLQGFLQSFATHLLLSPKLAGAYRLYAAELAKGRQPEAPQGTA